jgi:zinc protease
MLDRRLPSGARVVVVPTLGGPVAVQLWILAGTAAERRHEHGCAHLLEHMLFKPTSAGPHVAPALQPRAQQFDIASAIESLAGDVNAFTSHDETVFHATVPSGAVDQAIRALVGAVAHPRLDPVELRREARVVVQEIRQADDDPAGRVGQELLEMLYRGHAYGRPVLGRKGEVLAHDVRRLLGVHRDLYTADRSVLVVAGPVDPRAVVRTAGALLSRLPRRGRADALSDPRPPSAPRLRVRQGPVHEAHIALGWAAPPMLRAGGGQADAEAACALEVASVVLGYGEASRLAERVRRRAGLVTDAYASFYASRLSSALMVSVHTTGARAADAAAAVLDEIETLRRVPIDPDELRRAQAVIRSEVVYRQETVQGLAHAMGYQLSLSGDVDGEARYFAAIDALTPAAVRQACARWLAPARTAVSAVVPRHRARHDRALRSRVAARLKTKTPRRRGPRIVRGRDGILRVDFEAGLRLRAQVDTSVPMVAGWLVWAGGLRAETARDLGSSSIMAALLTRGSANVSGDALAREVDGMAAVLEGFAGRNSVGMHFECLAGDVGVVVRRAVECAAMPAFDPKELDEERRVALEELAGEKDDTGGQAFAAAYALLYRGHPFRWRRRGTEGSLQRLTVERCRTLWERSYPLSRAVLGLAGDFDVEVVVDLLDHLLPRDAIVAPTPHSGPVGPTPWSPKPPSYPRRSIERVLDGAREQAHVVRLYPGLAMGDPRIYALEVLTTILGGQAGRLFQSLREDKGLVYHVSAGASEGIDAGHVSFYAATSHRERDVALAALAAEIERAIREPVSADELGRAKAWLCGQFEVELQRRSRIASSVAFDEAYGLGAALHLQFPRRVRAVTAADVHAVARELLDPRRAVTVLTRPRAR